MVVDLTATDQVQATVQRAERLVAVLEVDDRQADMSEPGVGERALAATVRAAMADPVEHPAPGRRIGAAVDRGDPAHA